MGPARPNIDGTNILGTPYGSPEFVEDYLNDTHVKHKQLLSIIKDVAKMGYSREAHQMITNFAVPRLTHVLKSVPKDETSKQWMEEGDKEHLSTWM